MNQRLSVFAERNLYPHLYLQLYQTMSAVQQPAFSSSEAMFTTRGFTCIRVHFNACTCDLDPHFRYNRQGGSGCDLDQATPTYDSSVPLGFKILARTLAGPGNEATLYGLLLKFHLASACPITVHMITDCWLCSFLCRLKTPWAFAPLFTWQASGGTMSSYGRHSQTVSTACPLQPLWMTRFSAVMEVNLC